MYSAVLTQYRLVTDRQTDRYIYRAIHMRCLCVARRGKSDEVMNGCSLPGTDFTESRRRFRGQRRCREIAK